MLEVVPFLLRTIPITAWPPSFNRPVPDSQTPGRALQPNAPVVQATVPEILKQAYAMERGTQKEIIIDHGDGLCSKLVIEPSTDEALTAFIDPDAAKNFAVLPR